MKTAALQYAREGWLVFPVHRTDTEHTPCVSNWPELATDSESIVDKWWSQWPDASIGAIPASAGLLAVDYDTKHGKSLTELQEALSNALGIDLPDTGLIATSPSGGQHHYYMVDEPVSSSNSRLVKGVDIRSAKNGYILLPPSMGGRYRWLSKGHPVPMPVAACERFGKMGADAGERPAWQVLADLPDNIALARAWLEREARPSVGGEGGNQALYDTACMMVSFAVSQDKACELLADVYNPAKCNPPWEDGDIVRTVSNAYRYHTSAPGNLTPGFKKATLGFSPLSPKMAASATIGTDYFRITDRDAMRALPSPRWVVEPILQEETCAILTGGYASYKSFVALDMALCVATNPETAVWQVAMQGPAVYMLGEGRSGMSKRLAAWEKHHGITVPKNDILFVDPVPHISMDKHIRSALTKALLDVGDGYRFIVIDTMGRAMAGLNENASETASMLSAMASDIRNELGACVLAIGHTRKDRATGQGATRGSGVFENDADTVLNAEKTGANSVSIEVVKQKDAPEAASIDLVLQEIRLNLEDTSLVVTKGKPLATASTATQNSGIFAAIDLVACEILAGSPHDRWSTRNLADHVARDGRVPMGVEAVRKKLVDISCREAFNVSKMFLPAYGQHKPAWKYAPIH